MIIELPSYHSPIWIDDEDSDLADIVWSRRNQSNDFYNRTYGALHRVIASRKVGRLLDNQTYVKCADGDCCNLARNNLILVDRAKFISTLHKGRTALRRRSLESLITIVHMPLSDQWKVIKDGSYHPTEAYALEHYERIKDQ